MDDKATEITSPLKAIRAFCLECCGGNAGEVRSCTSRECVLKPFRLGHNPFTKRAEMTDERKEELRERGRRLAAMRYGGEQT